MVQATATSLPSFIVQGYDRKSAWALAALVTTYSSIGYSYSNLIHPERGMDWLLGFIWVMLTALVVWRVDWRRDLRFLVIGLLGGATIEWWGTNTSLWVYFTRERPPLWILPAWPIAALAIDRLATLVDHGVPRLRDLHRAYWVVVPAFVVWMTWFALPSIDNPATWVVIGLMVGVTALKSRPRWDIVLFVSGAAMGVFLEYWGTSRHCWTYYTGQVPPPVAVFAHGFASIAFARANQYLEAALARASRATAA